MNRWYVMKQNVKMHGSLPVINMVIVSGPWDTESEAQFNANGLIKVCTDNSIYMVVEQVSHFR